jgi:hypothetical protein
VVVGDAGFDEGVSDLTGDPVACSKSDQAPNLRFGAVKNELATFAQPY